MNEKKKALVIGGSGLLGSRFLELSNLDIDSPDHNRLDIFREGDIEKEVERSKPEIIINFAAFTNVKEAEIQRNDRDDLAYRLNSLWPQRLSKFCKKERLKLLHISTEYVYDGNKVDGLYKEGDPPNPKNWYGITKNLGDQYILDSGCESLIVAISMPYRSFYKKKIDIVRRFIDLMQNQTQINAIGDAIITPVFIDDVCVALDELVHKEKVGRYNVASLDFVSPFDLVIKIADLFNFDKSLIMKTTFEAYAKDNPTLLRNSGLNIGKFNEDLPGILHTVDQNLNSFKSQFKLFS